MDRRLEKDRLDEIIGKNIRLERDARKLSRDELAEIMELTTSHMGLIERGERGATAVTLSKLSKTFDIPIDHFFTNPKRGGLSVREGNDSGLQASRKKIHSLITRLSETELDFVVHAIKGVIAMTNADEADE